MAELVPFGGLRSLRREMDRLFDRFFEPEGVELPAPTEWTPRVDVSENKETITVKAEVPGIEAKDIDVSLQDQRLTIKGEKKQEKEEKDEHYYRVERTYGAFARSIRLPAAVDPAKIEATFKNGVLMVVMHKTPAAKGTSITVKAA